MKPPQEATVYYNPGQSVHFKLNLSVLGSPPTDLPDTIAFTLRAPDGTIPITDNTPGDNGVVTVNGQQVRQLYSDQAIPFPAAPGDWVVRWQTSGNQVNKKTFAEYVIGVNELDY